MRFINYINEITTPYLPMKNPLFKKLCKASRTGDHTSSVIRMIFNPSVEIGDIASECDLEIPVGKTAEWEKKREAIKKEISKLTQQSLSRRGLPDPFLVYRGGDVQGSGDDLVPVSLDKGTAYNFSTFGLSRGESRPVYTFSVKKSAVVADVSAISVLRGWDESELLVRKKDLKFISKTITEPVKPKSEPKVDLPKNLKLTGKLGKIMPA